MSYSYLFKYIIIGDTGKGSTNSFNCEVCLSVWYMSDYPTDRWLSLLLRDVDVRWCGDELEHALKPDSIVLQWMLSTGAWVVGYDG